MAYEYHKLRQGLSIYKQAGSKNFYLRMRVHDDAGIGSDFVQSLRTPSFDEASEMAWGLYFSYKNQTTPDFFISSKSSTISSISSYLVDYYERGIKKIHKDYLRVLRNEIVPNVGHLKIKDFDRSVIRNYLTEFAKSSTQLTIRKTAITHIFERAVDKRLIKEFEIPSFPKIELPDDEVRSMLHPDHSSLIDSSFDSFIDSSTNSKVKARRVLFRRYFQFLLSTGVRPGLEAVNIRFSDIAFDGNVFTLKIRKGKKEGKSKSKYREIPLSSSAVHSINKILNETWGFSFHEDLSFFANKLSSLPDAFIFLPPNLQSTGPQYEKVFDQLCKHCKIDKDSLFYTLYSCRHTYITKQLIKGVDIYLLAVHCGTSVEMIQKNYSKLTAIMRSYELVGEVDYNAPF